MRPTLNEVVINQYDLQSDLDTLEVADNCYNYAKLTNRPPKLGDFVPCDEDGNVLEEPEIWNDYQHDYLSSHSVDLLRCKEYQSAQDRVIFKGDWEVVYRKEDETCINYDGLSITFTKSYCFCIHVINRIEDLPREIEFKEGVI